MLKMRASISLFGLAGIVALLPLTSASADQVGRASWYAMHSRTASGEVMNPHDLTAASRTLPFGTHVLVQNLNNGRSVMVRINDRGPFTGGRIIDVSEAAASALGMIGSGTATVRVSTSGRSTGAGRVHGAMHGFANWRNRSHQQLQVASRSTHTRRHVHYVRSAHVTHRHSLQVANNQVKRHRPVELADNAAYGIFGGRQLFFQHKAETRLADRD